MIYRDFKDLKLSALGMGTMRLPVINGVYADINQEETEKMVDFAMKNGVNYQDIVQKTGHTFTYCTL